MNLVDGLERSAEHRLLLDHRDEALGDVEATLATLAPLDAVIDALETVRAGFPE
jgi:hypothetical protein